MSAPTKHAAHNDVTHPEWCDRRWCKHIGDDGYRPVLCHSAAPSCLVTEDAAIRLALEQFVESGVDPGPPIISVNILGFMPEPAIVTVPEAVDLIRKLQALVDLATLEGRRTA